MEHIEEIQTASSEVVVKKIALTSIFKPFTDDYLLYWGSITANDKMHQVVWILCRQPMPISMSQVAEIVQARIST